MNTTSENVSKQASNENEIRWTRDLILNQLIRDPSLLVDATNHYEKLFEMGLDELTFVKLNIEKQLEEKKRSGATRMINESLSNLLEFFGCDKEVVDEIKYDVQFSEDIIKEIRSMGLTIPEFVGLLGKTQYYVTKAFKSKILEYIGRNSQKPAQSRTSESSK